MYGKTIFSHNIPALGDGNPKATVDWLVNNNFEGVLLKVANGNAVQTVSTGGPWPTWGENVRPEMVRALKEAGIKVILWHFVYGIDPHGELNIAVSQIARFQPDAYVWDAESSFDSKPNAVANAVLLSNGIRTRFPSLHQSLCWWALPKSPTTGTEWHPVKVAQAFFPYVDAVSPMMYWPGMGREKALNYLLNSLRVWSSINPTMPLIPVGRAYTGDNGTMDPEGIAAFSEGAIARIKSNNIIGISWWFIDHACKDPVITAALAATPKFGVSSVLSDHDALVRLIHAHPDLFPDYKE